MHTTESFLFSNFSVSQELSKSVVCRKDPYFLYRMSESFWEIEKSCSLLFLMIELMN